MSEHTNQPDSISNASALPDLVSSTAIVLQRTQMTLGLLHEVVQESSAEYWYERGNIANIAEAWDEAIHAYELCTKLAGASAGKLWWDSLTQLGIAYKNRSAKRLQEGDTNGSLLDAKVSEEIDDYLGDIMDGMSQYND